MSCRLPDIATLVPALQLCNIQTRGVCKHLSETDITIGVPSFAKRGTKISPFTGFGPVLAIGLHYHTLLPYVANMI
jgi:hypothetical protein